MATSWQGEKIMNALVLFADGSEEAETILPIDVLRRAGVEVTVAGVGGKHIVGAHKVAVETDKDVADCDKVYDMIVIPGGIPGAVNIAESYEAMERIINTAQKGIVGCICASPAVVLGKTGILEGHEATCYPGMEKSCPSFKFSKKRLVVDDRLITAQGPAVAMDFAFALVEKLLGKAKRDEVAEGFLYLQ
jgi:4-methyl-5(b-hydroxyethyl)-thiazole monophosphate biosynthesis